MTMQGQLLLLVTLALSTTASAQVSNAPPVGGASGGQQISAEQVMANNDLNKDGSVTKQEATKADKQLIRLWDSFDMNGDGKVDISEVRKTLALAQGASQAAPPSKSP